MYQILKNWSLQTIEAPSYEALFHPRFLVQSELNRTPSRTRAFMGVKKIFTPEVCEQIVLRNTPDVTVAECLATIVSQMVARGIHPLIALNTKFSFNYDEDIDEYIPYISWTFNTKRLRRLFRIPVRFTDDQHAAWPEQVYGTYYFHDTGYDDPPTMSQMVGIANSDIDGIISEMQYVMQLNLSDTTLSAANQTPDGHLTDPFDLAKDIYFSYPDAELLWAGHFHKVNFIHWQEHRWEAAGYNRANTLEMFRRGDVSCDDVATAWFKQKEKERDLSPDLTLYSCLSLATGFAADAGSLTSTTTPRVIGSLSYWDRNRLFHKPQAILMLKRAVPVPYITEAEQERNDRRRLVVCFNYTQNVVELIPGELREKGEELAPTYGVELEVSTDASVKDIVYAPSQAFCICKNDSSISGSRPNRYEIVTIPATLRAQKRHWYEIFSRVGHEVFDTTRETNNGMHVHIGWDAFVAGEQTNLAHVRNFVWFWGSPLHREFHRNVAERDPESFSSYASSMRWDRRATLPQLFRAAEHQPNSNGRSILAFKRNRSTGDPVTVEVRAFKGIVSLATVYKNLEMVDASLNFTRQTNFAHNNINNFLQYLDKTPKSQYQNLKEFFRRYNPEQDAGLARASELLWNVKNLSEAVVKINQEGIKMTSQFLNLLHQEHPGCRFEIGHGDSLQIVQDKMARLADLDGKMLTRRYKEKRACA